MNLNIILKCTSCATNNCLGKILSKWQTPKSHQERIFLASASWRGNLNKLLDNYKGLAKCHIRDGKTFFSGHRSLGRMIGPEPSLCRAFLAVLFCMLDLMLMQPENKATSVVVGHGASSVQHAPSWSATGCDLLPHTHLLLICLPATPASSALLPHHPAPAHSWWMLSLHWVTSHSKPGRRVHACCLLICPSRSTDNLWQGMPL